MRIEEVNWFGFKHESVKEKFEGNPEYVGTFAIGARGNSTHAVYYVAEPNLAKGHKNYMLLIDRYDLTQDKSQVWVSGMTVEDMEKERFQTGLWCQHCDTVIYSQHRHDMHSCKCKSREKQVHVDGGKDYMKVMYGKKCNYRQVKVDLIARTVVKEKKACPQSTNTNVKSATSSKKSKKSVKKPTKSVRNVVRKK